MSETGGLLLNINVVHLPGIQADKMRLLAYGTNRYTRTFFQNRICPYRDTLTVVDEDFNNAPVDKYTEFYVFIIANQDIGCLSDAGADIFRKRTAGVVKGDG